MNVRFKAIILMVMSLIINYHYHIQFVSYIIMLYYYFIMNYLITMFQAFIKFNL